MLITFAPRHTSTSAAFLVTSLRISAARRMVESPFIEKLFQAADKTFWCKRPAHLSHVEPHVWRNLSQSEDNCNISDHNWTQITSDRLLVIFYIISFPHRFDSIKNCPDFFRSTRCVIDDPVTQPNSIYTRKGS